MIPSPRGTGRPPSGRMPHPPGSDRRVERALNRSRPSPRRHAMEITRRGEHGEHRSTREQHVSGPDTAPRPSAPSASPTPEARPSPSPRPGSRSGTRSGSRSGTRSGSRPSAPGAVDTVSDVVRWAAFACVVVPAVLLWCGSSLAGAAGTALGLAAVTGVCVILLRQSERGAALLADERRGAARSRAHRPAPRRRGRHGRSGPGGRGSAGVTGRGNGSGARIGPRGGNGTGVHRGARHSGGGKPVD